MVNLFRGFRESLIQLKLKVTINFEGSGGAFYTYMCIGISLVKYGVLYVDCLTNYGAMWVLD